MTPRKSSNNPRNGKAGLTTCRRHSNSPAPQSPTEPVPISSNRACPYLLDLCGVPSERVGCSFSIPGVPPRAGIRCPVGALRANSPSPQSLSLSTTPSEPQRACPYLQLPPNLSLSPKTWPHGPSPCFRYKPRWGSKSLSLSPARHPCPLDLCGPRWLHLAHASPFHRRVSDQPGPVGRASRTSAGPPGIPGHVDRHRGQHRLAQ